MLVISNGMLRSGSTLQYNIARMVLEARYDLKRVGFMGDFAKPKTRDRLENLRDQDRWSIIKTHESPLPRDFYTDRVRVLFSYRDVRDIAASIRKKWDHSFEEILSEIDAMIQIHAAFADIPSILVQPYDLLYRDIPTAICQIASYIGVDVNDSEVCGITDMLSVDSVCNKIEQRSKNQFIHLLGKVIGRFRIDRRTQMHENHISVSKGRSGDWINRFTAEEIAVIECRYADWLNVHGYLIGYCSTL